MAQKANTNMTDSKIYISTRKYGLTFQLPVAQKLTNRHEESRFRNDLYKM